VASFFMGHSVHTYKWSMNILCHLLILKKWMNEWIIWYMGNTTVSRISGTNVRFANEKVFEPPLSLTCGYNDQSLSKLSWKIYISRSLITGMHGNNEVNLIFLYPVPYPRPPQIIERTLYLPPITMVMVPQMLQTI